MYGARRGHIGGTLHQCGCMSPLQPCSACLRQARLPECAGQNLNSTCATWTSLHSVPGSPQDGSSTHMTPTMAASPLHSPVQHVHKAHAVLVEAVKAPQLWLVEGVPRSGGGVPHLPHADRQKGVATCRHSRSASRSGSRQGLQQGCICLCCGGRARQQSGGRLILQQIRRNLPFTGKARAMGG